MQLLLQQLHEREQIRERLIKAPYVESSMVVGEVTGNLTRVLLELGSIALWLQALGVIVILWIVFEIIALYFNRKRMKEIYTIKEDMKRIESKIDAIARATKR